MPRQLQKEIDKLEKDLLTLATLVEERVRMAVRAIDRQDTEMAEKVIEGDRDIDRMEVDLEEEGLKVLALHQPVAIDLRYIVAILKINNDLERIGDLAVNLSKSAVFLATQPRVDILLDFVSLADKAQAMLKKSLDALVDLDENLAYEVCAADDEVDAIHREMDDRIKEEMRRYPERIECFMHLLSVSRRLERIADHATNIAEDVMYMIEGEIVRHKAEVYRSHCEGRRR